MTDKALQAAKAKLEAYHGITIPDMIMEEAIAAYEAAKGDGWLPKEQFEVEGSFVIAWLSSDKFEDITANLYFSKGKWRWEDSDMPVKRPDLINGVFPYPLPPESERGE